MTQTSPITLRAAGPADARALHALITAALDEGHLLPRAHEEIAVHASRFVVAVRRRKVVGCAELAPLSGQLAEVRSLAVHPGARHQGVGSQLVRELRRRARHAGFEQLCVLTHAPEYFTPFGFSIVPHLWVPEKVFTDCVTCPKFRACGQFAMVLPLDAPADAPAERQTTIALQVA
ncbi:MAG: GNAT family N-acetyltransferase [Vicinamibacterales bacterium]